MNLKEIISRRKNFRAGTKVVNCVSHIGLPITTRPQDCNLCYLDMKNYINYVLDVNKFLNELFDKIEEDSK